VSAVHHAPGRDARQASRSSLIFVRVFIVVLCATAVGTAVWGWQLVGNVRSVARLTDTRMRTLGWATLSYVSAHDGAFPTSNEELMAFGAGPETLGTPTPAPASVEPAPWPLDRATALRGEPPQSLADCFHAIVVTWGSDRRMPPFLKPDGLPTLHGTNVEVNGWLDAARYTPPVAIQPANSH